MPAYMCLIVKITIFLAIVASVACLGFIEIGNNSSHWYQIDKLTHFLLFGLLTIVVLQIASESESSWTNQLIKWGFVLLGMNAVGVIGESIHLWVPYRSFELNDMIANLLGTNVLGLFHIGILFSRNKNLRNTKTPETYPIQSPQTQSLKFRLRRNRHRFNNRSLN